MNSRHTRHVSSVTLLCQYFIYLLDTIVSLGCRIDGVYMLQLLYADEEFVTCCTNTGNGSLLIIKLFSMFINEKKTFQSIPTILFLT